MWSIIPNGIECRVVRKEFVHKMSVAKMKMLRCRHGNIRKDRKRNEVICKKKTEVALIEDILREWFRLFEHIQHRLRNASVKSSSLIHKEGKRVEVDQQSHRISYQRRTWYLNIFKKVWPQTKRHGGKGYSCSRLQLVWH